MDPQLDVNALIRTLAGATEFIAFCRGHQAAGLTYNLAARSEFLAGDRGTEADLGDLERTYALTLISDVSEAEVDAVAARLEAAFDADPLGRLLHRPDARILATVFLKGDAVATGDLQLFKRARDLGLAAYFIGAGRALARATVYVPCPVSIPGGP